MLHVSIGAHRQVIFVPSSTNLHTNMLSVSIGANRQVIFEPSSTNLDKNMAKLSIGWSSSTDLHENLYRLFACRANALCRK
jgi:hypothetical protein